MIIPASLAAWQLCSAIHQHRTWLCAAVRCSLCLEKLARFMCLSSSEGLFSLVAFGASGCLISWFFKTCCILRGSDVRLFPHGSCWVSRRHVAALADPFWSRVKRSFPSSSAVRSWSGSLKCDGVRCQTYVVLYLMPMNCTGVWRSLTLWMDTWRWSLMCWRSEQPFENLQMFSILPYTVQTLSSLN